MSYDIYLKDDDGEYFNLDDLHNEGGTYTVGGTKETHVNITYNYSWYYYKHLDEKEGIRFLYGKKAKDCIDKLIEAIEPFKDHKPYDKDYWADTPGNCVAPLRKLLTWCKLFPEGVFSGD